MKKIEIILRVEKIDPVVSAIKKIGVGGLSVMHIQGQGKEDVPLVGHYYSRGMIMTVVEESKVNEILKKTGEIASTEHRGDGKIFISNVEEVMDLCTQECGHHIL